MGVDVIVPPAETAKTIEKLKADAADPEVIAWTPLQCGVANR
jgi:hypothetical protein